MQRIAIQGQAGSFHDAAARHYFQEQADIIECEHFADELELLHQGRVDFAVCAIENSTSGTVVKSMETLRKHQYWICGEIYLRVEHCLIGLPGASLSDITEVHSQAPALGQCEEFLDTRLPHATRVEQHDTTASVAMIKSWQDPHKAAIASAAAAKRFELSILKRGIQTQQQNYTRFLVLQKHQPQSPSGNKTSLTLITNHQPGALYRALGCFAKHDINLSKIESHPIPEEPFRYIFYIDIGAGLQNQHTQKALEQLADYGFSVQVLGTYQDAQPII